MLKGRISAGDWIMAVDGEDVSHFSVTEVTAVMARKYEYERTLTVLRRKDSQLSSQQQYSSGSNNVGPSPGGGGHYYYGQGGGETGSLGGTSYQSGYSYGHPSSSYNR